MGHPISIDEMTIRRNSYKCRSDSIVVRSNGVSTTETKPIRSHLSDPRVLKAMGVTVVPTRALVVYQCDWLNN